MIGMDSYIHSLYQQGKIAAETATDFSLDAQQMAKKVAH
jgi:Tfp pilus assembly pilus retraction ATPase PilT